MRVIAGSARGVRLVAPEGLETRPTSDRVREALFNILGPRLQGAHFLDLFAGTGANGVEALSRGATRAVFVENNRAACACILQNLEKTKLGDGGTLFRTALPEALARVPGNFDLVFVDPPYRYPDYQDILKALQDYERLAPQAVVVVEHEAKVQLPEMVGTLQRTREARYGQTTLAFYA